MPFELTIATGERRGERVAFDAPDVVIGRAAASDLVVDDASVSRVHARIRARKTGYVVCDGGSTNGTAVNGVRVDGSATLHDGDRIGAGTLVLVFGQQAKATRRAAGRRCALAAGAALAAALALGIAGLRLYRGARSVGPACPEVIAVEDDTANFSFGRGAVDFACGQSVSFGFTVPAKARVRFHYLARPVAEPGEVELKLNGKHLAWAPAAGARGEPQSIALPDALLGARGRNVVTVQARGGKDWSVSGVALERASQPRGDEKAAREAWERGRRKLDERRVAPRNLYDAWRALVEARQGLEDLDPRPALYAEVALLAEEAERELGRDCARLLFAAERHGHYGLEAKAQLALREVLLRFPGDDPSGCRRRAREGIASVPDEER
ncbi:MAG: hypothetical protein NVS2B9_08620 [Myxococcales bacterium]